MAFIGQDVVTAFMANLRSQPNHEALFVQTASGEVSEVHDPNRNLLAGAYAGQIMQDSALQIGDALYFAQVFQYGNPDDGYYNETSMARLNRDGSIETLTLLPGGFAGRCFARDGAYVLTMNDPATGSNEV